mgnify:CR=1 FL=1
MVGEGKEVGPSGSANREFLQGLYLSPSVVSSALKTAILTSKVLETLGFKVSPRYNEHRADIVELIYFNNREQMIIRKRFFDGKTQMEVADEIGISQAQVSRLEKSALLHMRKSISNVMAGRA